MPSVHPAGSGRRHGTIDADGTDWACSQSGSGWRQSMLAIPSGVVVVLLLTSTKYETLASTARAAAVSQQEPEPTRAPPLNADSAGAEGQQRLELRVQVASLGADQVP